MDEYRMIDGKDFANFVAGFVSFIKEVCDYVLASLGQYFMTAVLIFSIVICSGLFAWSQSKGFYEAVVTCTFSKMNKKTYGEMLHNLDLLAQSHSYDALAKQLNIPLPMAQKVMSIEGKNMAGSRLYEDITPETQQPIYIDVKAADNSVFPVLETALLHYVNTASPYITAKTQMDSAEMSTRIKNTKQRIAVADSVIAMNYGFLKRAKPFSDTNLGAAKFVEMIRYKSELEAELERQTRTAEEIKKNVEVLHSFVPADQPVNNKNKIVSLTIVASLISSCGATVLRKALHDGTNPKRV